MTGHRPQSRSALRRLGSSFSLYWALELMSVRERLSYVVDVWIDMVLFALQQTSGLFFLWVIFDNVRAIANWTLPEMVFLYGMYPASMGLYRLFFSGVRDTGFLIMDGAMDQVLTKPRDPLLLLSCRRSNYNGAGDLLTGIALFFLAGSRMGYAWTVLRIAQLALFLVSANAIIIAIMTLQASACFWLVRFTVLHDLIMELREYSKYPISIYGWPIRVLVSTAVPLAFASYVPASTLLGKDGFNLLWTIGPPAVAALFIALAIMVFHVGLRFYKSTGS